MLDRFLFPVKPKERKDRPLVSFLVITYGRAAKQPWMLNEAVWWCCNQDYPNVEVLVLNDAPNQRLFCDHPKVRVINWPERVPDLGSKMNLATLLAAGSICCPAEDDDISLPHRAKQAVQMTHRYDCWFPMRWLFDHKGQSSVISGNGYGYTSCAYKRDSMIGNHPLAIAGHDKLAAAWMKENLRVNPKELEDNDSKVSYVYRWNVSPLHLSGHNDPVSAFLNNDPGPSGEYRIEPKPLTDWSTVLKRTLE